LIAVTRAHEALLERFYRELYLAEFAAQREPLEAWHEALWGSAPYRLMIRIAVDGDAILGGIVYELYPRSACGLVTYMVVAPGARRAGRGKQWLAEATADLRGAGARVVFGEVAGEERLARNLRWGARIVDVRYTQPALGPGLERDRGLVLIALDERRDTLPGAIVRDFVIELYEATEGRAPEAAILDGIPETVRLHVVSPQHGDAHRDR
jgi:GNAT superfamily N-acetyltransferase